MEHLIEQIDWINDHTLLRGFVFGVVHTIIPLVGFYSGWSINRLLKIASNGYIAGIFGVILAHVVADFIAASLDPHMQAATLGIVIGGLLPVSLIPLLDKYITKSKHHIIVGDHEDIKKDLEDHHH